MKVRRRFDRRTRPYMCQHGCGEELHITGQWGKLPGILKCRNCGHMDRRLPGERRATPPEVPALHYMATPAGRTRLVLVLELLLLAAVGVALLVALL